jgi:hypothetical protein
MRTPKIEALHRLINWINIKNKEFIPLLDIDTRLLNESSWLSDFIEADGSFYLNLNLNLKIKQTKFTYWFSILFKIISKPNI